MVRPAVGGGGQAWYAAICLGHVHLGFISLGILFHFSVHHCISVTFHEVIVKFCDVLSLSLS
jgi:hypothetical protein